MKKLIIFIILLIITIYINYDFKTNDIFQIIQLSSDKINQNLLYEKLPILIQDKINNLNDFISYVLKYEFIEKTSHMYNLNNNVNYNLSNYMLIYNSNKDPIDIYISHPKNYNKFKWNNNVSNNYLISNYNITKFNNINNTQFVQIKLKPKQTIILPKFWLFVINGKLRLINLLGFTNYITSTILSIFLLKNKF